jgi:hypothetical protein
MLEMTPVVSTWRATAFNESAMYSLPLESTATATGLLSVALVAGPPSPV